MAAVLKLDTIEGAELTYTGWNAQQVRSGVIVGIPVDGLPDSQILEKALGVVLGNVGWLTNYPGFPGMLFRALKVTPLSGNSVRVFLLYSTPDWGGNSAYLIRDNTYLQSIQTNFLPGTKVPFRVRWQDAAGENFVPPYFTTTNDQIDSSDPIYDSIKFNILVPTRAIQITQISYGTPPTSLRPLVGQVNSDTSFLSVNGVGMWLISRFTSEISKYQGSYTVEAEITTKNIEDWSLYGILQNKSTGQFVDVSDTVMAVVNSRPYSYGLIYGAAAPENTNGIVRIGPYRMTSFSTAFPGLTG